MTEEEQRGLAVWNAMQHDPNLLEGITVGEMADLITAVSAMLLMNEMAVMRSVPVGLMLRLTNDSSDVAKNFDNLRELLRVDLVRKELTKHAQEIMGKQ